MALDRAFALEPHTETLVLRGRILRDAGEFYAAEVAFEAARHSAEHDAQRETVHHEIAVTRRLGAFTPRWVRELTPAEEWFAEHGTVVLSSATPTSTPSDAELVDALIQLSSDRGWTFGQVVAADASSLWPQVAQRLRCSVVPPDGADFDRIPLLVATRTRYDDDTWSRLERDLRRTRRGLSFILWHEIQQRPEVDVVGGLLRGTDAMSFETDPSTTLVMAQHPAARLAHQMTPSAPAEVASP